MNKYWRKNSCFILCNVIKVEKNVFLNAYSIGSLLNGSKLFWNNNTSRINAWAVLTHDFITHLPSKVFSVVCPHSRNRTRSQLYIVLTACWCVFVSSVCPCLCVMSVCVCVCISHLAQNPFICDCHLKWLADYLRSNPIETSGARCASPRRLANKRIGQIKSKKFRCSGRLVAQCLQMSPLLLCLSRALYLYLRQALLFLLHLSLAALLLPPLFLSAGSGYYLCIVPSYHI